MQIRFFILELVHLHLLQVLESDFVEERKRINSNNCLLYTSDDKIYVLLDIKPKEKLTYDDCNNVFCYSGKGRKIWQIGV